MSESNRNVPSLGAGDVEVVLGGRTYVLRPSLDACRTLSRLSGGIRGAIDKCASLDFDTVVRVIQAGIGNNEARKLKNIEELIFEKGLMDDGDIVPRCIDYLSNIANGGRPMREGEGGGSTEEDPQ
jgi:hypothetical protein